MVDDPKGHLSFIKSFENGSSVAVAMPVEEMGSEDGELVTVAFYDGVWGPQFTASMRLLSFNPSGPRPTGRPALPDS